MTPNDQNTTAILMEDFNSKMDMIVEYMDGAEKRMIERMDGMVQQLVDRMDGIELKLIRRMDDKFAMQDRRFDAIEGILAIHSSLLKDHTQQLERIEAGLDLMAKKVGRHDRILHA